MVQRRPTRYTSKVSYIKNNLKLLTQAERCLKTRLIILYKVIHGLIAITSEIVKQTDSYNKIKTYKWSFFPIYHHLIEHVTCGHHS